MNLDKESPALNLLGLGARSDGVFGFGGVGTGRSNFQGGEFSDAE